MPKKVLLAPPENIMVQAENLVKIYKSRDVEVMALQGLDLTVERGELMGIVGASGSGKSTLLNMLGGLDRPSAGSLYVDGVDMLKFTEKDFIEYKRKTVGFVWQNNARNLIPYLTAKQNVEMPMLLSGFSGRSQRADELLDMVGLSHRKNSRLDQMSGGEQQRVAIAIALSNNPKLLLADEPTGSVDTATSKLILDVFREGNGRYYYNCNARYKAFSTDRPRGGDPGRKDIYRTCAEVGHCKVVRRAERAGGDLTRGTHRA